jgi:hypothetical protein
MVPPDSYGDVDRSTQEIPRGYLAFTYKTFTFFGQPFQIVLLA